MHRNTDNLNENLTQWGYLHDGVSVEQAIAWYQENHIQALDDLTQRFHYRSASADGDMGPATSLLINTRFCEVPDRLPHQAYEEANWPSDCRDDITISWDFEKAPGLSKEQTDAVWQSVKDEYESQFEVGMRLMYGDGYGSSRINAKLLSLSGGVLAWSYLADNNCGSRLQQSYKSNITWSYDLAIGTWKHEVGHAMGMHHTPGDRNSLMYPSMNGQTRMNATDIANMKSIGYKFRDRPPIPNWSAF